MNDTKLFELRLFDRNALTFSVTVNSENVADIQVISQGEAPLPLGLSFDNASLERWLETRAIPYNRANADKLCIQMGIDPSNTARIVEVSRGLSLNDSYWAVPEGFSGSFDDYNLFENDFSRILAIVAYTGRLDKAKLGSHGLTPELATGGSLPKAWRIDSYGRRLLYKGKTESYAIGVPLSESAVSAIAEAAGLDHTRYWLDTWMDQTCSVCECFCTKDISYVPFAVATGKTSLADAVATMLCLGSDMFEDFVDMLMLDCICENTDRHLTNFGFLYQPGTNTVLGLAPIFDNGRALFPNIGDSEIDALQSVKDMYSPAFGAPTFDMLAGRLIGDRQKEWLSDMKRSDLSAILQDAGLSPYRAKALSSFVVNRCSELVEMPSVSRSELKEISLMHFPDAISFAESHGQLLNSKKPLDSQDCTRRRDGNAIG